MPLYEYQCQTCEQRFERIQKFSDPPVETCPSCGGKVKKLLSSPAIQFKGSGWYITDYAKKSGGTDGGASSSSSSGSSGSSGSESKSESASKTDSSSSTTKADTPAAAPAKSTKSE
jgi:putative FmdB family regulatory protein